MYGLNPLIFKEKNKDILKSGNMSIFKYKYEGISISLQIYLYLYRYIYISAFTFFFLQTDDPLLTLGYVTGRK